MAESRASRRTALKYLLAAPLLATAPALSGCSSAALTGQLDIASGEPGGMYFQFATLLADALREYGIAERSEVLSTEASAQNLQLLAQQRAQLSLALADTVAHYRSEAHAGERPLALGRVYQNYFHCIVRAGSKIAALEDLAGRRLGTGAPGSGTWVTGQRILRASGLSGHAAPPIERKLGYHDGLQALARGEIEALFLFGGMPVSPLAALAAEEELDLLDLSSVLGPLRAEYPGLYDKVVIPAGTYRGIGTVETVGVGNLLMARADLPDDVAAAIVKLLVGHARDLVPESSAGIQFLTEQTLISTAGQPLHPGARTAYRRLHG